MKFPWRQATWEASIKANVALSILVLILGVMNLMTLHQMFSIRERIVLVPPVVDKTMSIGWDSANEDYLKSFGLYVATLVGNITASDAKFVTDNLSKFMDHALYTDMRQKILAAADTRMFKEAAGATKFLPKDIYYEPETRKVFVSGSLDLVSSNNTQSQMVVYEMTIKMEGGKPVVYSFESYPGIDPHTTKWIADHPAAPQQKQEQAENK